MKIQKPLLLLVLRLLIVRKTHNIQKKNNAAMDLINSITGTDEEGRSRQRILTFAAKRYASAIERNPDDYDALYNWALVLQKVLIMLTQILVHHPKMLCLKRLARSMTRLPV